MKIGEYKGKGTSEDQLWSLFSYVFSDSCKKTNTYKFGLIKAICDQIYTLREENGMYFISYVELFESFTENYWNLVAKYNLKQMTYNGKSYYSKIERIIKEAVQKIDKSQGLDFQKLDPKDRKRIISLVKTNCKKNVIGALYENFDGKLYSFDLSGEGLYIGAEAFRFISKYKIEIEKLNYYSWARYLENINEKSALEKLLNKLEEAAPRRGDLSLYKDLLFYDLNMKECFYCGKELSYRAIHADHFIPWTFMKTDNLWNLVISCRNCNLKKSDRLVDMWCVNKIEHQNQMIICNKVKHPLIEKEYINYDSGLIVRLWNYAKMNGYREITMTQTNEKSNYNSYVELS